MNLDEPVRNTPRQNFISLKDEVLVALKGGETITAVWTRLNDKLGMSRQMFGRYCARLDYERLRPPPKTAPRGPEPGAGAAVARMLSPSPAPRRELQPPAPIPHAATGVTNDVRTDEPDRKRNDKLDPRAKRGWLDSFYKT